MPDFRDLCREGSGQVTPPPAVAVRVTGAGVTRLRQSAARECADGAAPSSAARSAGGSAAGCRSPGKRDSGDKTAEAAAAEVARTGAHALARQIGGARGRYNGKGSRTTGR